MKTRAGLFSLLTIFSLFLPPPLWAGVYVWANASGNWADAVSWGGSAPTGLDASDVLIFRGDVRIPYTSSNNIPLVPMLLNQLIFDAPNSGQLGSSFAHRIDLLPLGFAGDSSQIVQNNAGAFLVQNPITLRAPLTLEGDGQGSISLNGPLSGAFDITKAGSSTFNFGSVSPTGWIGRLTIASGEIRAYQPAPYILSGLSFRANPVTLASATSVLAVTSTLNVGVLSGAMGLVESQVVFNPEYHAVDSEDIIIHALADGTYGGTIRLGPPISGGKATGTLIIRGAAEQTFTGEFVSPDSVLGAGALQIQKDVEVGHGATLRLAGEATLVRQASAGAIVMSGGTFKLDNRIANRPDRLRDGDAGSTGLDSTGGGLFSLLGNASGTHEVVARLQLGSATNARSGALSIQVVHSAGAAAATELSFQSLERDGFVPTFTTVDFSGVDPAGHQLALGQSGAAARVTFLTAPVLANGLLRNTRNLNAATIGWATVNGSAFATYGPNGIAPVTLTQTPIGSSGGDATANVEIRGNFTVSNIQYALNSLRLEPTAAGQALTLTDPLRTNALLLAGDRDYSIAGGLQQLDFDAAAALYVHVASATLSTSGISALTLVKAGDGTLAIVGFGPTNTVLNAGVLRAPVNGSALNTLSFRGGVLEISGGGTFSRPISPAGSTARVEWSAYGVSGSIKQNVGSGGFAAFGSDAIVDLDAAGPTPLEWEMPGFVQTGQALIFGSRSADHRITWVDQLDLGASGVYNAREFRVNDNPATSADYVRLSSPISGGRESDLLKTGPGTLELTGAVALQGAILVHEGTLLLDGPPGASNDSLLTEVHAGAKLGGNGKAGPVRVLAGGLVAPGSTASNTALFSTGDFTLVGAGAIVAFDLGGSTAGTSFDQLVVSGAIRLNGGSLAGTLLNGFTPAINDLFFLILNDGDDQIAGRFAQGSEILIGNVAFEIGYSGSSENHTFTGGNDLVLRSVPEPSTLALTLALSPVLLLRPKRNLASSVR